MSVKLRGHHLLCILTFMGHGYSRKFSANYGRVVKRLNAGEGVVLVDGPDDICDALIKEEEEPHCFNCSVLERDKIALQSVSELLGRPLAVGDELDLTGEVVSTLREAFANGPLRSACYECEWSAFCDGIAENGYEKVHLRPPPTH
ncbi:DUF1284 domain-containing protein [Pseudovibrio sp. Tun.PSC04-5.I4]|uniref:DUF1284 domain-containing protein n=1 Tax=Pseudovibrio sp. Tun.PSC04-5.I4 TaxID=1798213 RepID=UPI0008880C60|nr:DUF1284 domain-containing protein [Pseudovibrio sp. Tun.PSC04-5.I4]SDR34042.1 hypothetical protein SAMN04515695_4690 [Pseudovibrio sp. Tun.PSC04-5.I4]